MRLLASRHEVDSKSSITIAVSITSTFFQLQLLSFNYNYFFRLQLHLHSGPLQGYFFKCLRVIVSIIITQTISICSRD